VTEIPEHLLRRSRERREALGLSTGDEGAATPPASTSAAAATPSTEVAPAAAATPAPAPAPAAPAVVAPPPKPPPPYVEAALRRKRIPYWAIPVVALLPLWAFIYQWSLTPVTKAISGPLANGQALYIANCSSCHLPTGAGDSAGGIGFQLSGGSVLQTFPDMADQVAFVKSGSEPFIGKPYGNPDRPGGQRVGKAGMPAWGEILTDQEVNDVVCYERVVLSGQDPVPANCTTEGAAAGEATGGH
jgi:mono/diheme cytochrome c family protein